MKIAFVSLMNGVPWGGSEELWFRTAKKALTSGHQVVTLTRQWHKTPDQIGELKGMGAYDCFYSSPVYGLSERIAMKLKLKSYKSVIFPEIDADVFVISNGSTFDFLYNRDICDYILSKGKPYIMISQHNFENGGLIIDELRDYSIDVFKNSKKNLFVSERNLQTAERQIAYSIPNTEIISNPINIHNVAPKAYPKSDALLMACVARLDCNFKGQDILLQVLSTAAWKDRKFSLRLYGSGPHERHLKELIQSYCLQDKVSIEGQIQNVDAVWEKNEVLVLPSLSEGTPLALVEAMLSGRAAVATDVGDIGRYIKNGKTGYLAPVASLRSLSDSLEELWMNRTQLNNLGKNAFSHSLGITDLHPEERLLACLETIC